MPAKYFRCPDLKKIEITKCLQPKGCRLGKRCYALPYLRLISYDREWQGISPSAAGNGIRLLYLKATCNYTINPKRRVWAAFGTTTHQKLSLHSFNVLTEERLTDEQMKGIADLLEDDEYNEGYYILFDYKTWGSFKVAKALGITVESKDEPILEDGEPVLLKSGPNKGEIKTKKLRTVIQNDDNVDLKAETLQINRYRIFYENKGFPISGMFIQALARDGDTYVAKSRGIDDTLYVIPIERLDNKVVLDFYNDLINQMDNAMDTGKTLRCHDWEAWGGRRCTEKWCDVFDFCN